MAWSSHGRSQSTLVDALVSNGLLRSPHLIQAFKATDRAHFIPTTTLVSGSGTSGTMKKIMNPYQDSPQSIGYNVTISAPHMHAMMAELIFATVAPLIASKAAAGATPQTQHQQQNGNGDELQQKGNCDGLQQRDDDNGDGISILDVGSGSGYLTAIMAHMLTSSSQSPRRTHGHVYGIEHVPELVAFSRGAILQGTTSHISSAITIMCGDGRQEATYQQQTENMGDKGSKRERENGSLTGSPKLPPHFDAIHVGAASHRSAPHALVSRLKPGGSLVIPIDDELHVITRNLDGSGCTDRVESGVRFVPLTSLRRQLGEYDE